MLNILNYNNAYFIGIGGIGMSALARWFHARGIRVAGYDRTESVITQQLADKHIPFTTDDSEIAWEQFFNKPDADNTLIIYTPAIPLSHPQLKYFKDNQFTVVKRAEVLASVAKPYKTIAVAGTHGKTTTAAMITFLMTASGIPCYAFLGGIAKNFESNYVEPDNGKQAEWCIVEADEYDRSFLHLSPDIIVLNSADPDHLDIYHNQEELTNTYKQFTKTLRDNGKIYVRKGLENLVAKGSPLTFDLSSSADFYPDNIRETLRETLFVLHAPSRFISGLKLRHHGRHNLANATVALAVTSDFISDDGVLKDVLKDFAGLKRRFEIVYSDEKITFIDDYAHHPVELKEVISSCKQLFPEKKITAVFQPHLYSRTRDFMDDFARVLEAPDEVILLPVYPAREEAIAGISAEALFEKIDHNHKWLMEKDALPDFFANHETEILLTLGAGDIDREVDKLKQVIMESKKQANDH